MFGMDIVPSRCFYGKVSFFINVEQVANNFRSNINRWNLPGGISLMFLIPILIDELGGVFFIAMSLPPNPPLIRSSLDVPRYKT
jgi:hypothetical protein